MGIGIDIERELKLAEILSGPFVVTRKIVAHTLLRVARAHELKVDVLRGPRRDKRAARARRDAFAALRNLGLSLPDIGRELCRDHSTVLYGLRKRESEFMAWKEIRT